MVTTVTLSASAKGEVPPPVDINQLATLYNTGQFAELESRSRMLIERYPDSGFVWKVLGTSLQVQGKDALPAMQKAAELLSNDAEVHSNLGSILQRLGQPASAAVACRRALELNPNFASAHYNLGNALQDIGQLDAAVASYRRALEIKPDFAEAHCNLGIALKALGQLDGAMESYRQALRINPNFAVAQCNMGSVLKEIGQLDEAVESYLRALEINPDYVETHFNLGIVLKEFGRLDEAAASYRRALEIKPDFAEAYCNLANTLKNLEHLDDAVANYRRALEIKPDFAEAHYNLGIALQYLGRFDAAVASYRRALEIKPDFAEIYNNLGLALKDLGQLDDAVASYHRALEIKPDFAEAYSNLGFAQHELGQLVDSEANCRRALEINPDFAEAHGNLGITLQTLGQLDGAVASYRRALEIKPDAEAYNNLGIALQDIGQLDAAMASYRHALEINPDLIGARFNLGLCLLEMGWYSEGWQEYEYRGEGNRPKSLHSNIPLPQWIGQQPSSSERLLIIEEQGMGDRLQFSRYLSLAADRFAGGVGLVSSKPLRSLFQRSFPSVEILEDIPADLHAWQWQCPLLSLPLGFRTTLETIPTQVPYLIPDPVRVACWQTRIADLGLPSSTCKIGLVWKTGNGMKTAAMRSLTLQQLAPLLNLPNCAWFSLQKEPDPDKAPWVTSGKLIDWAEKFGDFDETASLAINFDLIISVDTAVAHLAGGLGRPTWLFNRYASEWRWMRDREDSPWYPTMRIFTQKKAGEWDEVVKRMATTLTDFPLRIQK